MSAEILSTAPELYEKLHLKDLQQELCPFDRFYITYCSNVVTTTLSGTLFEILTHLQWRWVAVTLRSQ